jgi:hypothetical protein
MESGMSHSISRFLEMGERLADCDKAFRFVARGGADKGWVFDVDSNAAKSSGGVSCRNST